PSPFPSSPPPTPAASSLSSDSSGHLERIRRDIGIDERLLTFLAGPRLAVLHAEDAVVSFRTDVAEEMPIVHLARARFLATRIVADLEIRDLAPGVIDVRDDVTFVALHVVHVVEDLAGRTVHRAADLIRLVRRAQEQ